jgi:ATP-binding cassette subfamily B multidrug efflux pump
MVQQDPVVLADTFYANVTLGRDIQSRSGGAGVVQLAELARGLSGGFIPAWASRAIISPWGRNSCWRWRVLVDTPQVLILDEATANIDSGTEQAIQQALAAVRSTRRWW